MGAAFPREYALANHVDHPPTVYLREGRVLPVLDGPRPLLVELDLARHIPGRQVDRVVDGKAHRDRRLDGAWCGACQYVGDGAKLGADGTGERDALGRQVRAAATGQPFLDQGVPTNLQPPHASDPTCPRRRPG
jgi:hypothetical protein